MTKRVRTIQIVSPTNIGQTVTIRETTEDDVKTYHRQQQIDVRPWGESVSDYIQRLELAVAGFAEATIDGDAWDEYGSTTWEVHVEGWYPATEAEIQGVSTYDAEVAARQKARDDADIARLRKAHPDIFKA